MPRPRRRCIPGATYHVYSRCIEWKCLIAGNEAKDLMIATLRRTLRKYRFELAFYQVMDSHFHLVIRTLEGEATISRIMQYFKARYAESFNRIANRIGPFWNERFKDIIADEQPDPHRCLLGLLWHIAYNPVRKKSVLEPGEYRYGSIMSYLRREKISAIDVTHHAAFNSLGASFEERSRRFLQFELEYLNGHAPGSREERGQSP